MKITFVVPEANLSGGIRVVAVHADGLARRGHSVVVVAPKTHRRSWKSNLRALLRGEFDRPDGRSHFDGMNAELKIVDHAGPITERDVPDADVIVATWWETAFSVVNMPPSKGRKYYFVQGHEVFPFGPAHISGGSYYLPLKKIVVSQWLKDIMRDRYGDCDVGLVPNAVDRSTFFAAPRAKNEVPTVGLLYGRAHLKGTDICIQALEMARRRFPNLRIVAFGVDPPSRNMKLPDGSQFFLRPDQNRLKDIYAMCDVWLSSSRSEGFGLPILEAMACRCPVVATRTGCVADVIRDGINGFVVDVENPEALGARLIDVLSLDSDRWRKMSDAALESVGRYTWDDATELLEQALR